MKKLYLIILFFITVAFCQAQNVGIDELQPGSKLSVKGNLSVGNSYSNLTIGLPANGLIVEGNVGIGLPNPSSQLHTTGTVRFQTLGGSGNRYVRTDNNGLLSGTTTVPWTDITGAPAFITSFTEVDPTWNGAANETGNIGRTGNVGVGTLTPGQKLHVKGNVWASESSLIIDRPNTTGGWARGINYYDTGVSSGIELGGIGMNGNDTNVTRIYIAIGNDPWSSSTGIHLLSNGRVGIGTTAPLAQLHTTGNVRFQDLGGSGNRYVRTDNIGNLTGTATVPWSDITGAPAFITNFTELDPTWNGAANETGNIGRTGKVGIGTNTPSTNLHIRSNNDAAIWLEADADNATESDNPYIKITQDGQLVNSILGLTGSLGVDPEGNAYTSALDNTLLMGTNTGWPLQLGTNSTVRLTIASNGNIGIGTTAPATKLHVAGGDVRIDNLAGSGNVNVIADNNGTLIKGTSSDTYFTNHDVAFDNGGSGNPLLFIPLGNDNPDDVPPPNTNSPHRTSFAASSNGKLVKVVFRNRTLTSQGSVRINVHLNGSTFASFSSPWVTLGANTHVVILPDFNVSEGNQIQISVQRLSGNFTTGLYLVSTVWEFQKP